jgi:hypothetical protein
MYNNAKRTWGNLQRFISTVLQFPATRYARAWQRPCDVKRVTSFLTYRVRDLGMQCAGVRPWGAVTWCKTYPCQNTFRSLSFCLELWMNYAPLTRYEQEYLTYKAHFEALPIGPCSLRLVSLKVWSQRSCLSVIQAGTPVHKTHSSALTVHRVHLATAYVGLKECAVTKEFCKHSLPVLNACNLFNHFHI